VAFIQEQDFAARQYRGRRENQEDYYAFADATSPDEEPLSRLLLVLGDGLGAHAGGSVASYLAVGSFIKAFHEQDIAPAWRLRVALEAANETLGILLNRLPTISNSMGTTLVACMLVEDKVALCANVGDSRGYLVRNGQLHQITRDHSLVARMVEQNRITAEEARNHPHSNILLRTVGTERNVDIDIFRVDLEEGDRILLCSDGLWSGVSEIELAQAFLQGPVSQVVPELVRRAVAQGGLIADNVTAIALNWEGGGSPDELPTLSQLDLPGGAITTTIAFGRADQSAAHASLSDEEIERQIAEIQQAIRRTHTSPNGESS
jgi:serine/threonine protein phosphatase PrpC